MDESKVPERKTSQEDKQDKMKLQLALDFTKKKDALKACKKAIKHIDIIELGTPLIKAEGISIIKAFKRFKKPILADLKTMDTGFLEAELAFQHGADIATVCGAADLPVIEGAIKAARKYKKKILVDLIGVQDTVKRAKQILKLKPTYIGIHTGIDAQHKGKTPLKDLKNLSKFVKPKQLAIAGGISLKTIYSIVKFKPDVIIVGGAITSAKNPKEMARQLKEKL